MRKGHKIGPKGVNLSSGHRPVELNFSNSPVVISSASFKRYDLEERSIANNSSVSLASIVGLGRFIPSSLKPSARRKEQ